VYVRKTASTIAAVSASSHSVGNRESALAKAKGLRAVISNASFLRPTHVGLGSLIGSAWCNR